MIIIKKKKKHKKFIYKINWEYFSFFKKIKLYINKYFITDEKYILMKKKFI